VGAIATVEDDAHFQASRAKVIATRERMVTGLAELGFEVLPSVANFVFARHPDRSGAALAAALRENAILVRHFAQSRIRDYLRITVGTDAQVDRLIEVLGRILEWNEGSD
jgi:histidinol-phosphate aminotransferase